MLTNQQRAAFVAALHASAPTSKGVVSKVTPMPTTRTKNELFHAIFGKDFAFKSVSVPSNNSTEYFSDNENEENDYDMIGYGIFSHMNDSKVYLSPYYDYKKLAKSASFDTSTHQIVTMFDNNPVDALFLNHIPKRFKCIMFQKYGEKFPFKPIAELATSYPATFHPIMSQRGATCSTDVIFTILFESEFLRPLFYTPDWAAMTPGVVSDEDCCISISPTPVISTLSSTKLISHFNKNLAVKQEALRNQYLTVLNAAKTRYDRMIGRGDYSKLNKGSRDRRSLSVENTLWESMLYPIKPICSTTSFLRGGDVAIFLDFLLTSNGMKLPTLGAKNPFHVDFYSHEVGVVPPSDLDMTKVIALILLIVPAVYSDAIGDTMNHYIGMYRNGGTWFLVDNEVGYIHQIMDTDWVNNIFLPRLNFTLSSPAKTTLKNPEKKVYAIYDHKSYKPLFTNTQFVTLGERFYPNVNPCKSDNDLFFYIPKYGFYITKDHAFSTPSKGGATGGGSAVASTTRKGRRSARKSQTRRRRS